MAVDRRGVLRNIEGDYLLDYALFTGAVRVYVTHGLEEHFRKDPKRSSSADVPTRCVSRGVQRV